MWALHLRAFSWMAKQYKAGAPAGSETKSVALRFFSGCRYSFYIDVETNMLSPRKGFKSFFTKNK